MNKGLHTSFAALVGGLTASAVFVGLGASPKPAPGPLEATAIRLVDAQGTVHGSWEVRDGVSRLILNDAASAPRIELSAGESSWITLWRPDKKPAVTLTDSKSAASFLMYDKNTVAKLRLSSADGGSFFFLTDSNGKRRFALADALGQVNISLKGPNGEAVWEQLSPREDGGAPNKAPETDADGKRQ
jgi:hypothetical protein